VAGTFLFGESMPRYRGKQAQKEVGTMEDFVELVFGSQFFQLPFLEALSYVAAVLLVGAIVVGLTRRALGIVVASSTETKYAEQPSHKEDTWEWRKAA
jgi:hypothetical protein